MYEKLQEKSRIKLHDKLHEKLHKKLYEKSHEKLHEAMWNMHEAMWSCMKQCIWKYIPTIPYRKIHTFGIFHTLGSLRKKKVFWKKKYDVQLQQELES